MVQKNEQYVEVNGVLRGNPVRTLDGKKQSLLSPILAVKEVTLDLDQFIIPDTFTVIEAKMADEYGEKQPGQEKAPKTGRVYPRLKVIDSTLAELMLANGQEHMIATLPGIDLKLPIGYELAIQNFQGTFLKIKPRGLVALLNWNKGANKYQGVRLEADGIEIL